MAASTKIKQKDQIKAGTAEVIITGNVHASLFSHHFQPHKSSELAHLSI